MTNEKIRIHIREMLWMGLFLICLDGLLLGQSHSATGAKYYISPSGNDNNNGSQTKPWKSLDRLNRMVCKAGDKIFLQAGQTFKGSIHFDWSGPGQASCSLSIGSYGEGKAVIDAGNQTAIELKNGHQISVSNLMLIGSGRNHGNKGSGVFLFNSEKIELNNIEVSGFQKSGVEILDCADARIQKINAHDNGFAGIAVEGTHYPTLTNHHIYIGYCKANNNPGDPSELNNHSGNGIIVGLARKVLVEYCSATNNGWDMPRKGNGPVGIWAWMADSITIQYCISYRNRTAPGAMDGGGFDLDGGVTNSLVQYNLAYENEGYGYGIFQFSGASPWHHNTYRYNISFDDGNKTQNGASVLWWNGSRDSSQFHDCYFYNNLLYNSKGYALGVVPNEYLSGHFLFLNNIIIGKDELMSGGKIISERFFGNDWWSLESGFKMNGKTNFSGWSAESGQESMNHRMVGLNVNPQLKNPVVPTLTDPRLLNQLTGLQLNAGSPLHNKGLDLQKLFQLHPGNTDFFGNAVPLGVGFEPGVCELQ